VSSILDALRELEAARRPGRPAPGDGEPPAARLGLLASAILASLAGTVVSVLVVRSVLLGPPRIPDVGEPPAAAAPAADAGPPPAPAVDPTPSLATAEPPRARIAASDARAPGALASATPFASVRPARRSLPRGSAAAGADLEQAVRPGEPRVVVVDLAYADDPAARRITLGIGGRDPVTLGEGDAAGGVEVSLILPDVAYLRHAGNIFAVRPRR